MRTRPAALTHYDSNLSIATRKACPNDKGRAKAPAIGVLLTSKRIKMACVYAGEQYCRPLNVAIMRCDVSLLVP